MKNFREFINEASSADPELQAALDELVGVINKYLPKINYEHSHLNTWELTGRKPAKYNQKLMQIWKKEGYESGGIIDGTTSHAYTKDGKYRANFGFGFAGKTV